ncbi:MAG: STAS domain-containing protein [Roseivirga sp.]|nr:STAS domain-containing protein [Roseivirga sp.]
MEYKSEINNGILFFTLSGDLIGEVKGPELLEKVNDAINKGVVLSAIDISDVRYINSSGIGVLITMLTKFRNQGGEVCIVNPSEHVKKLLIITKLTAIFNIADTVGEAVDKLKSAK